MARIKGYLGKLPHPRSFEEGAKVLRDLMGATDPAKAAPRTIRKDFASSIEANAVHGSDSPQSAAFEIPYFFGATEIHLR